VTPLEAQAPTLSGPERVSAGVPAVLSTGRHILAEMGPLRGLSALARLNQKGGYDCPGCAWPDPDHQRSIAEFCENGAKAVAEEATMRRADRDLFARWTVQDLSERSDRWLGKQGRLTEPMLLAAGEDRYRPISWEEAFERIAAALHALPDPDGAVFYTSGRTSNEAAFLYQLFVRLFGTNNMPDCSNMCHESSGTALSESIGVGKGTVLLDDFDRAEVILVLGQNPGTNHPRMLTALEAAKREGCTIVSINPLPEAGLSRVKNPQDFLKPTKVIGTLAGDGTQLADLHLPVRPGGDIALLKGVMKALLALDDAEPGSAVDRGFVEEYGHGYEAFAADLREESWERIERQSGVGRAELEGLARLLAVHERIIACWAMGLTQHRHAVAGIQEVVNLLLMRGAIGKPGAGACPVRGHSNVQGDRTMGIWERPSAAFLDRLGAAVGFEPPREHGLDTVAAIRAMERGEIGVFVAMGGNFLSATPDTARTAAALTRCRLTVQISTKLNRSHLITGDEALILPCLARSERDLQGGRPQFVSVENSFGIVHSSQGHLPPASERLRSEPAIVAGLARAVFGPGGPVDWESLIADYDRIRDLIAQVVPGTEDYRRRILAPGGFVLPNDARERRFATASGRAEFTVHEVPDLLPEPGRYLMMTIRSHDQYNTTIYGLDDRYRGVRGGRRVVLMNLDDLAHEGLASGDAVDLTSHFAGEVRRADRFFAVPYPIPRGCVATYFPEANVLVPLDHVAERSNTPASKSVVVEVHTRGADPALTAAGNGE
jgi:molybdopterin-dependent oxidoreductase alpha subunit